jgi:replicative DNA helicase
MARGSKSTDSERKGRVPPQNLEAEQSTLGGILIDPESINKVVDLVSPEDFYREDHGTIYGLMLNLYEKNEPIDLVTVSSLARDKGLIEKIGGATYLNTLVDLMPTSANIAQYARMIREKSMLRSLITVATEIVEKGYGVDNSVDTYIDDAEKMIFQVAEKKQKASFFAVKDLVIEGIKTVERLCQNKQSITGVSTGFTELDKMTSGLQPSDLIIVAGRPSMGKTAFALDIARQAAQMDGDSRTPVGIFSLEMSKEQLVLRLLTSESQIEFSKLRNGSVSAGAEWQRLADAANSLYQAPIYIDDTPSLTVLDLRARARRLKKEHGLGLLVVDYLQLMRGRASNDSREQEISEISRFLKALAKEINIPVIAISQLNRKVEDRPDKRPRLADLRESGAIEQDADVILFIYRDEVYNKDSAQKGIAEVIIGKQRNGPIGDLPLTFISSCTAFRNYYGE